MTPRPVRTPSSWDAATEFGVRSRAASRSGGARVLVVSGSVGAGHDGAARELAVRLRAAGVATDVRDLLVVFPDPAPRVLRDGYRLTVDWVPAMFDALFTALEGRGLTRAAMLGLCRRGEAGVGRRLRETRYDAVVSTYPLASQALGELRRKGLASMPLITYLTDPAVHRSWLHPCIDLHLTVTAGTASQGKSVYGMPMVAAGRLVSKRFSQPCGQWRLQQLRAGLALPADRPVALLMAGSLGLGDLVPSVRHVTDVGAVPLVLCGRNARLRHHVGAVPGAIALGWRDDVHELMALADVLVHNAGGLSVTEALVAGLPAISYRVIPGHGQANAALLRDTGLAPWARDPSELREAVAAQLRVGPAPHRHRAAGPDGGRAGRPGPGTARTPPRCVSMRPGLVATCSGQRRAVVGARPWCIRAGRAGRRGPAHGLPRTGPPPRADARAVPASVILVTSTRAGAWERRSCPGPGFIDTCAATPSEPLIVTLARLRLDPTVLSCLGVARVRPRPWSCFESS